MHLKELRSHPHDFELTTSCHNFLFMCLFVWFVAEAKFSYNLLLKDIYTHGLL